MTSCGILRTSYNLLASVHLSCLSVRSIRSNLSQICYWLVSLDPLPKIELQPMFQTCLSVIILLTFVVSTSCLSIFMVSPLMEPFKGKMILAPLTKGGNLPFRRLCADFGMQVSMGEMVFARMLNKGNHIEQARLRRAPNEDFFGVQIATNNVEEGLEAIKRAKDAGADFVDLNCGCPIYEATRRGLGSALLRSPSKLGTLVHGMASSQNLPVSVKVRLGCETETINVHDVVQSLCSAGAAAVTIHGRTAQQRYTKPADWKLIRDVVKANIDSGVPIVGNGDILMHYEARRRMLESGVESVMVGRGALIKPWIFKEFRDNQSWEPSEAERIAIYRTLTCYMKEHFGNDDLGRKITWKFLPWHFDFLTRYRALPEAEYGTDSLDDEPLIQKRATLVFDEMTPLEQLLSHRSPKVHDLISNALWESDSDAHAVSLLKALAESADLKNIQVVDDESNETLELANVPSNNKRRKFGRRGRDPKPPRTEQEIVAIRAERAAKKARLAAESTVL